MFSMDETLKFRKFNLVSVKSNTSTVTDKLWNEMSAAHWAYSIDCPLTKTVRGTALITET